MIDSDQSRPSQALCAHTVNEIERSLSLIEVLREPLNSPMSPQPVGEIVVWEGDGVDSMIYIGVAVPPIGLDSHMVFAFAPPDSTLPHFTLDSVQSGDYLAFHLDLMPRLELATNLGYMDQVFSPLTETFDLGRGLEGLSPAQLGPRQIALMSPWMLANRATVDGFAAIKPIVDAYRNHWLSIVQEPGDLAAGHNGARARDLLHRSNLFNPDVDRVWAQMDRLLGEVTSAHLQNTLKTPRS